MGKHLGKVNRDHFPVSLKIPVAWGEMDAFQHVNNIVYLRWFESARIAFFEQIGMMQEMANSSVGPILGHVACTFKFPVTFPDEVTVYTRIAEISEDRFVMEHQIWSQKSQRLAVYGHGLVVMVKYPETQKTAIPEHLRKKLANFT